MYHIIYTSILMNNTEIKPIYFNLRWLNVILIFDQSLYTIQTQVIINTMKRKHLVQLDKKRISRILWLTMSTFQLKHLWKWILITSCLWFNVSFDSSHSSKGKYHEPWIKIITFPMMNLKLQNQEVLFDDFFMWIYTGKFHYYPL